MDTVEGLRDTARRARESAVIGRAVTLARWIGNGRRPVTAGQVLRKADVPAAGAALGVDVPPRLRTMADIRALHRPWCVAIATGLLQVGDGWVTAGPALERWPPDDADLLAGWLTGLRAVCAAESYPQDEDSVRLLAMALLTVLGRGRRAVAPTASGGLCTRALHDLCDRYDKSSWEPLHAADRYYDPETGIPLAGLVALLAEFGAVTGDPGKPVITPLGRWAAAHLADGLPGLADPGLAGQRDDRRSRPVQRRGTAGPRRVGMAGGTRLRGGRTGDPRRRRGDVTAFAQRGRPRGRTARRRRAAGLAGDEVVTPCRPARPRGAGRLGPGSRARRHGLGVAGGGGRRGRAAGSRARTRRSTASGRACRGRTWTLASRRCRATGHPDAAALARAVAEFAASGAPLSIDQVAELKVSLSGARPPIWRRVRLPATATLADLHEVIQVLFGWDGDHLHLFQAGKKQYATSSWAWRGPGTNRQSGSATSSRQARRSATPTTSGPAGNTRSRWSRRLPRDPGQDYPVCVAFRGDSPVEYWSEEEPEEPEPFGQNEVNRRLAALGAAVGMNGPTAARSGSLSSSSAARN